MTSLILFLRLCLRRHLTRQHLRNLSAHALADVGLTPAQRDAELAKWFWE
jgi:uncharacterized protein YjiS (DUF1127 family)